MKMPVRTVYQRLVALHELKADPAQDRAVAALDKLGNSFGRGRGLFARLVGSTKTEPAESTSGAELDAANPC